MSHEHREDPVLVLVRRSASGIDSAWFGVHAPEDPTYEGCGWDEPFASDSTWDPAWPCDVLRIGWRAALLTPDAFGGVVPSALEINARRLPWLRKHNGAGAIVAGTPLSVFCRQIAEVGGDVYVPLVGVQNAQWERWTAARPALDKAAGYG